MPAATATATDRKAETRNDNGDFVCLITGGDGPGNHSEPKVYEGKGAKRKWALHRSNAHGLRSERHERIRERSRTTARSNGARPDARAVATTKTGKADKTEKRTTRTRRRVRRAARIATPQRAIAYRVERAIPVRLDFEKPTLVSAVEVSEDGTLRVFQSGGAVSSLRVGTPYVAVGK